MGSDVWLVSFTFACLPVLCLFRFVFYKKSRDITFLRAEKYMEEENKTNGDAIQVGNEHNRRASIFLPIKPLKINTSWFDSTATRWGWDRSILGLVTRFSRNLC